MLAIVQEMNARVGVVTGRGLAALIRENFSLKVTALAILATVVANFGTTVAEFSGVAAAGSLFGVPSYLGVPVVAVGVWLLVTRGSYRKVERVLPGARLRARRPTSSRASSPSPDWAAAARGAVVPHVQLNSLWLFTVVAAVGTTLTPWGQFFIQAAVVDKKISLRQYVYTQVRDLRGLRDDDRRIDFFIVVACAATLYKDGIVVESAQEAAMALEPLLGHGRAATCSASACSASRSSPPACCRWPPPTSSARPSASRSGLDSEVRRGAGLQRPHHVPHLRAGAGRHDPAACRWSR